MSLLSRTISNGRDSFETTHAPRKRVVEKKMLKS